MVQQIGSHEKQVFFCDGDQQESEQRMIEVVVLERRREGGMRDRQGRFGGGYDRIDQRS